MKKEIILFVFLVIVAISNGQAPPLAFNYSAVARDSQGNPIVNASISIQISVLKSSTTGQIEYQENHFLDTDQFGLFNLVIGNGSIQSGSMNSIDWSNDKYYINVGLDVNGGTNFLNMGTTQLLSVPYALYAKSAGSVVGSSSPARYVGELYGGGVIFHLWKDEQGIEHGLVVDVDDLSSSQSWSNINNALIGVQSQSSWDGLNNTISIVSQQGHTSSAASLCLNSTKQGQNDWYLPSTDELILLWNNRFSVNKTLSNITGAALLTSTNNQSIPYYWSSTEAVSFNAELFDFETGSVKSLNKSSAYKVRAIRKF